VGKERTHWEERHHTKNGTSTTNYDGKAHSIKVGRIKAASVALCATTACAEAKPSTVCHQLAPARPAG
jgi:hypothetical protein